MKNISLTPIEELISEDFGLPGTTEREAFDIECNAFTIGEQLKCELNRAGMTQAELAEKTGAKKSFISHVENGKADIQLSTLVKMFRGLGREVRVRIL